MVGYSQPVHRIPNSTLHFRFYGIEGEELLKADVKLNNIGLISTTDYRKEKSPGEFRIVVLGGGANCIVGCGSVMAGVS